MKTYWNSRRSWKTAISLQTHTFRYCTHSCMALTVSWLAEGQADFTFTPLGPIGPARCDIMDPSAAMTSPGSPFCPWAQTHVQTKCSSGDQDHKQIHHAERDTERDKLQEAASVSLLVLEIHGTLATPCLPLDLVVPLKIRVNKGLNPKCRTKESWFSLFTYRGSLGFKNSW